MSKSAMNIASALFSAIESGDPAAVAALYADDVAVWHNFDDQEQDKSTNLKTLAGLIAIAAEIRYEVTERRMLEADRMLQRHRLRVRVSSGEEFSIPACIFVTVQGDRITRIEEYLDTTQANAMVRAGRNRIGPTGTPT